MVKKSAVLSFLLVFLAICGCGETMTNQSQLEGQAGEDVFPESMVGVWEVDMGGIYKWGFKIESDGSLEKIVHAVIGPVRLSEGGIYEDGPEQGTYCVFAMGPCKTEYNASTGMLKLQIIVDYFKMQFPADALEGRMEDYFEGPISDDGKTWTVSWRSYCWLEGAKQPDIDLIDQNPERLVFNKVDVNDIKDVNDVNDVK